jgi:hypothetical protein
MPNEIRPRPFVYVLVCLLFLTPLAMIGGPVGASTTITTLAGGAKDTNITFSNPGTDTSAHLALPKGCTITGATISLEGKYLKASTPTTVELTFNDTDNNVVWTGTTAENLSVSVKGPGQWQGGVQGGGALANDDGVYLDNMNKMAAFSYEQFKFKVDMVDLTEITIEWNGYAFYSSGVAITNDIGAQLFIWNNNTQLWEELGHYDGGHGTTYKDAWIKKTLTGSLDDYLFNVNEIRVVGSNWYSGQAMLSDIASDFIKAKVTGKTVNYPEDVKLDVGNDGTFEWTHSGFLIGMDTFSGDNFKGPLQSIVTLQGPGHGTIDITLAVSTTSPGVIRVGNISITLDEYVNTAPEVLDIPSTFHLAEDTDAPNLINVTHYFVDDIDKTWDMNFALVNESDPQFLHATVSTHGLMSFTTPTENWFGNATFKVSAKDTYGLTTTSQAFTVAVDPVADAPVLKPIGHLNFTEDKPGTIQLSATDPDTLFGGSDPFTYSAVFTTGTPFFTLNTKSGNTAFKATEDQTGDFTVTFTVTDSHGLSDSEDVDITIINVNTPPILGALGKQTLDEKKPYDLQLTATDTDKVDKDNLKFSVVFLENMTLFTMADDGHIAFTPTQEMVGTHHVRFIVTDTVNNKDQKDVIFDVKNVNDPPAIKSIADQKVNRNTRFSLKVEATDPDIGYANEVLTFADDSKMFDIDEESGWINFTPTTAQVGKYTIKVTVTDLAGASASTTFKLEVVLNNTAPEAKIIVIGNKTKVKEGTAFLLTAQATDKDNDPLTYKWLEGTKELGTDKDLTLKGLKAGKHTVTLEVSDGITKTTVSQVVTVEKGGIGMPGFDAGTALLALAVVGLALFTMTRTRK